MWMNVMLFLFAYHYTTNFPVNPFLKKASQQMLKGQNWLASPIGCA